MTPLYELTVEYGVTTESFLLTRAGPDTGYMAKAGYIVNYRISVIRNQPNIRPCHAKKSYRY